MADLCALWLPVLVSSLVVFFASFLAWMVLPHHKADVKVLPDEKDFAAKIAGIPPGTYMWPNCQSAEDMKSDEFKSRLKGGPWGSLNIMGKAPNFGANLVLVLLFYFVVSLFVGYITLPACSFGSGFSDVFQVAGATAVLGYCAGGIPSAIFFSKPCRFMLTEFLDSLAYGLITGAVFAWLWPTV